LRSYPIDGKCLPSTAAKNPFKFGLTDRAPGLVNKFVEYVGAIIRNRVRRYLTNTRRFHFFLTPKVRKHEVDSPDLRLIK